MGGFRREGLLDVLDLYLFSVSNFVINYSTFHWLSVLTLMLQ